MLDQETGENQNPLDMLGDDITSVVRAGADPEALLQLLSTFNSTLGLAKAATFAPQAQDDFRRQLHNFQTQVQQGYGSLVIHLGDGSSRAVLDYQKIDDDIEVKLSISKATSIVRQQLQHTAISVATR